MNERQFDSLDERIRQAAQQFEPPFEEADWLAMEALLDGRKKDRTPFLIWWLTDAIMIGLLLLICIKIEFFNNVSQNSTIQKEKLGILAKKRSDAKVNHPITNNGGQSQSTPTYRDLAETAIPKPNEIKEISNFENGLQGAKENFGVLEGDKSIKNKNHKKPKAILKRPYVVKVEQNTVLSSNIEDKKQAISSATDLKEIEESGKNNLAEFLEKSSTVNITIPLIADTVTRLEDTQRTIQEDTALKVEASNKSPLQTKRNPTFKPFVFASGSYGFERNWVTGGSVGASERVFGGFIGIQFSKRWGVQTGVLKTVKQYTGGDGSYKIPANSYWNKLTRVRAVCSILEIPILLRFNAVVKKNSNIYLSSGFVIHVMEKEEYHYNYQRTNGTSGYAKRFFASDNVHWFSGAYFGLGYERNLIKNVSISAEPFIKIPIQGIGQGSVKLFSAGAQLGGKWRFALPRRKNK